MEVVLLEEAQRPRCCTHNSNNNIIIMIRAAGLARWIPHKYHVLPYSRVRNKKPESYQCTTREVPLMAVVVVVVVVVSYPQ